MQQVHRAIKSLGGKIFFVGTETTESAVMLADKNPTNIPLLLDTDGAVSEAYDVLFTFPDYLRELYKNLPDPYPFDLDVDNPGLGWKASLPATFIIDQSRTIRQRFINADFTKRMEPAEVLGAIRQSREDALARQFGPFSPEVVHFRAQS